MSWSIFKKQETKDISIIQKTANVASNLSNKLFALFRVSKNIDDSLFTELEETLLLSDVGHEATQYLITAIKQPLKSYKSVDINLIQSLLLDAIITLVTTTTSKFHIHTPLSIIMLVGVNGSGKTTTLPKLVKYFHNMGKTVMLAAGDTFRAAAVEQLQKFAAISNTQVISNNGDSASVCFEAIHAAKINNVDMLLIDTAGRLTNNKNLMEELKKIKRVVVREVSTFDIFLVLDATIGQNIMLQINAFNEALNITGLIITKMDSGKGGVICGIAKEFNIPIEFMCDGESIDKISIFNPQKYAKNLLY